MDNADIYKLIAVILVLGAFLGAGFVGGIEGADALDTGKPLPDYLRYSRVSLEPRMGVAFITFLAGLLGTVLLDRHFGLAGKGAWLTAGAVLIIAFGVSALLTLNRLGTLPPSTLAVYAIAAVFLAIGVSLGNSAAKF